jgi:hypothetical protein
MVYGRHRSTSGRRRMVPQDQWIWSPEPRHPAIVSRAIWDTAQSVGAEHGTARDGTEPATGGRSYVLRSRCRCAECERRMTGRLNRPRPGHEGYVYYHCPHNSKSPRHVAAAPGHPTTVQVREDVLLKHLGRFFATRIFGPGRAGYLAATLPATAAQDTARREAEIAALAEREHQIDTAEHSYTREIETLGHLPTNSAALTALRTQIIARFSELETEREQIKQRLSALTRAGQQEQDPALLDQLPILGDVFTGATARVRAQLVHALDTELLYSKTRRKLTMRATITPHTRAALAAIIEPSAISARQGMSPLTQTPRCLWVPHRR